jgi:hypothetical protein
MADDPPNQQQDAVAPAGRPRAAVLGRCEELKGAFERGELAGFNPTEWDVFKTSTRTSSSVMVGRGLRLVAKEATPTKDGKRNIKKETFICLEDVGPGGACWSRDEEGVLQGKLVPLSQGSTYQASSHLKKEHRISSAQTVVATQNNQQLHCAVDAVAPGFHEDPTRFYQNGFAVLNCETGGSYNTFKKETWNVIQSTLPIKNDGMKNYDPRKRIIEQYVHVKEKIMAKLAKASEFYGSVPFLSYNMDLYQDKHSNEKYLVLKVSWTLNGLLHHHTIAARLYNPSYAEREKEAASELLGKWTVAILEEFGIKSDWMIAGSGDSGSDVKKAMEDHIGDALRGK